ncbi:MAG: hypothetical protein ABL907_26300, partial [Hyphomicrobium sp.]
MKTQNRKSHLALALVAGASLLLASPLARADEKKGHEHKESTAAMPTSAAATLGKAHDLHRELVALVKA